MTAVRFVALRNRGTDLWTEIEAHRLGQEKQIANNSRYNLYLSIAAAIAAIVAGTTGAKIFGELGNSGTWITGLAGLLAAVCAALNPILRLSDEIQKATTRSQELKALQNEIRNHIYRMQMQATYTVEDQQLFFEQRADDFLNLCADTSSTNTGFEAAAAITRDHNNFPRLEYVGEEQADLQESIQEPSDDLIAFGMGS